MCGGGKGVQVWVGGGKGMQVWGWERDAGMCGGWEGGAGVGGGNRMQVCMGGGKGVQVWGWEGDAGVGGGVQAKEVHVHLLVTHQFILQHEKNFNTYFKNQSCTKFSYSIQQLCTHTHTLIHTDTHRIYISSVRILV